MVQNHICNFDQPLGTLCNLVALFRMGLDGIPFFFRKLARLIEDIQRDTDFTDVMQQAQERKITLLLIGQSNFTTQRGPHTLRTFHVSLGIAIAFLQGTH